MPPSIAIVNAGSISFFIISRFIEGNTGAGHAVGISPKLLSMVSTGTPKN
jgi:hypothetical protein